jgi:hypothetical protein
MWLEIPPRPAYQLPTQREADIKPTDQITVREAYAAMYRYLEKVYQLTGADDLGGLLGSMSLLPDGQTADPAAWADWIRAVEEIRAGRGNLQLGLKPNNDG